MEANEWRHRELEEKECARSQHQTRDGPLLRRGAPEQSPVIGPYELSEAGDRQQQVRARERGRHYQYDHEADVRYWHLADIFAASENVCF